MWKLRYTSVHVTQEQKGNPSSACVGPPTGTILAQEKREILHTLGVARAGLRDATLLLEGGADQDAIKLCLKIAGEAMNTLHALVLSFGDGAEILLEQLLMHKHLGQDVRFRLEDGVLTFQGEIR